MYTNQFHGTYFNITLIFILTSLGVSNFMDYRKAFYLCFTFITQVLHHQNLRCWLYAQQLKQAQDNYQTYIQKDTLNSLFGL